MGSGILSVQVLGTLRFYRLRAPAPAAPGDVYSEAMANQKHSRRDFLRGRAALSAAAEIVNDTIDRQLGGTPTPEEARRGRQVLNYARRAMACQFELRVATPAGEASAEAAMEALDCVDRLEDQLTVYRDQSELIDINQRAATEAVVVESRLFQLLKLCGSIHTQTSGAFDPTSGPLSRVWGFHQREGRTPSELQRDEALARVGWHQVQLSHEQRTIAFESPGVEINVNSIGKGYALDRAAEVLDEYGTADSLMHGGRSTLLARGDNPLLDDGGWQAGIRDPLRPEVRLAEFTLRDEALSTSGSGTQFFEHQGRRFGHLIDPRTGWPAEGLYSATVIAPTAAEADALSTAAYILGVEGTQQLCDQREDLKALLIAPQESSGGIEIFRFNLG